MVVVGFLVVLVVYEINNFLVVIVGIVEFIDVEC